MLGVVLVDRHELYRRGVAGVIDSHPTLWLVGQHSFWNDAIEDICSLECDLVIGDPDCGDDSAFLAMEKGHLRRAGLRLVVLSHCGVDEFALSYLKSGAAAFLTKDIGEQDLRVALDAVISGNIVVASNIASRVRLAIGQSAARSRDWQTDAGHVTSTRTALSRRELEVLAMIGTGACNKEVASALGISEHTVKVHVRSIMVKTNIHSRQALAEFVRESRIASVWQDCNPDPRI